MGRPRPNRRSSQPVQMRQTTLKTHIKNAIKIAKKKQQKSIHYDYHEVNGDIVRKHIKELQKLGYTCWNEHIFDTQWRLTVEWNN